MHRICDTDGCDQKANFELRNGTWCCSETRNNCPETRRQSSERMKVLNQTVSSPATKKGFKQPKQECPNCKKEVSKGNFKRHYTWCMGEGKSKSSCLVCGKKVVPTRKTCSSACLKEMQRTANKAHLEKNGLSPNNKEHVYINSKGDVLVLDSSYELSACIILDVWLKHKKVSNWEYNRSTKISYRDHSGKECWYFPDFVVDGKLIEVKGYKSELDELKWRSASDQGFEIDIWYEEDLKQHKLEIACAFS